MQRLERCTRWRAVIGATVLLCLASLGVAARTSVAAVLQTESPRHAGPISHAMPAVSDCLPCAGCYVAPAPSAHGFGGEGTEADAPQWRPQAVPLRNQQGCSTSEPHVQLPVRTAFCRWLV